MIVDLRFYTLYPGKVPAFLSIFDPEGITLQKKYCGNLIGYFVTETGELNQLVQLWGYESARDRDERRSALWKDPDWGRIGARLLPLIQHQRNVLLSPTAFSPIGGDSGLSGAIIGSGVDFER
jgi:hypothetical protein